jgi:hypothetical protein
MHRSSLAVGLIFVTGFSGNVILGGEHDSDRSVVATRQNVFSIPFTLKSADQERNPGEVSLYVSGDLGQQWALYQRQPADAGRFHFRAGQDGQFWFAVRTGAHQDTPAITQGLEPELKVIVDTAQPQMEFWAEAHEPGRVLLTWQLADENLELSSFRVFHKANSEIQWQPAQLTNVVQQPHAGSANWSPPVPAIEYQLRAEVYDRAGNSTVITRIVQPQLLARDKVAANGFVVEPLLRSNSNTGPPPRARQSDPIAPLAESMDQTTASRDLPLELPEVAWPGEVTSEEPTLLSQTGWRAAGSGTFDSPTPSGSDRGETDRGTWQGQPVDRPAPSSRSALQTASDTGADTQQPPQGQWTSWTLPEGEVPRLSRSSRFQLDYDLRQTTPDQVQRVELWITENGGQTWRHFGDDTDRISPFDVAVQQEGTYGFRLVVRADRGVPPRPPQSGEMADVWVHADWTPPAARLAAAEYGQGEHVGKMLIRWEARDSFLSTQAVSLAYSPLSTGPWESIASGLPNTGEYAWRVSDRVPRQFYLRLQVSDQAGNQTTDISSQPISVDGLSPQGRIRGVRPLPTPPQNKSAKTVPGLVHG